MQDSIKIYRTGLNLNPTNIFPYAILRNLIVIFLIALFCLLSSLSNAAEVTLQWDPKAEPDLAGYRLYYGTSSGNYQVNFDVGNSTSTTVNLYQDDTTYYFAVTAYDTHGNESDFSLEASFYVPKTDTDADDIPDEDEINIYGTAPDTKDTDNDEIDDGEELAFWGDAWNTDADGDGLINLIDPDSDNDGFSDGQEYVAGTDPTDPLIAPTTVYEDAEDGDLDGWDIYDDSLTGAGIENVFDEERQSRVIQLAGKDTLDGFRLRNTYFTLWQNTDQFVIEWSFKYTEFFIVYIQVQTTAGRRHLYYSPVDNSDLGDGEYVRFALGRQVRDGQWHTVVRDLQADLSQAQPDVTILEVSCFLTRGSGRIDDIRLKSSQ